MTTQNRQPKGIPTGGEFARNEHGDALVDLPAGVSVETPSAIAADAAETYRPDGLSPEESRGYDLAVAHIRTMEGDREQFARTLALHSATLARRPADGDGGHEYGMQQAYFRALVATHTSDGVVDERRVSALRSLDALPESMRRGFDIDADRVTDRAKYGMYTPQVSEKMYDRFAREQGTGGARIEGEPTTHEARALGADEAWSQIREDNARLRNNELHIDEVEEFWHSSVRGAQEEHDANRESHVISRANALGRRDAYLTAIATKKYGPQARVAVLESISRHNGDLDAVLEDIE